MQRQFTSEDDVIENLDGDIAGAALTLHISTDHLEYYWSHSIMYSCECSSLTDASKFWVREVGREVVREVRREAALLSTVGMWVCPY
jgi:hypothetical protein